ncbi:MAG: isoamylase early set domain-containing protein [Actinobacteria bacterium]|nr:isoamylase early set domain-containing protein [Actinomycetota bacterium]
MLKKKPGRKGTVQVTFDLPDSVGAEAVALCGDFNEWSPDAHPMKRLKKGVWRATVSLPADHTYRFRYLLDGERWENDWQADAYEPNGHGEDDSIVVV